MKKYIKPETLLYSPDTESLLLEGTFVHNAEGNGIQRSKPFFGLEDDANDADE